MMLRWVVSFLGGNFFRLGFDGGGSSAPAPAAPTSQTVTQTNLPEYAQPYVETLMGKAQALTDTSQNPYQQYGGQRIAGFTPMQEQSFQNIGNMSVAPQIDQASQMAGAAGLGGLGAQGQAGMLGGQALGYGMQGGMYGGAGADLGMSAAGMAGMGTGYGSMGAGYGRAGANLGMDAAGLAGMGLGYGGMGAGYGGQAAQQSQQGFGAGQQYAQQATSPEAMRSYMSPYMQNVIDTQKEQAVRDYSRQLPSEKAAATAAGAFGGSRQAILQGMGQESLNRQLGQIESTGMQNAYDKAQQAQQFGANLGLQGLQAGYQGLGMGMQGAQAGMQGLQSANQLYGTGLQGLGMGMQGAQSGMQGLQTANQLYGTGLQGLGMGMQGAQTGLQGVGQAINAGQYGLQGLGLAGQQASTLGQLGQTQYGQQMGINAAQQQAGAQQQAQNQQSLTQQYQDFLNQQKYPYQQLGFMSDILRGVPLTGTATQSVYQAPPNPVSQFAGLAGGLGSLAYGLGKV